MTCCHTNPATAPLSACHEVLVKTLPIQADLSCSPLPLVTFWLCTAAFSFILLPFCLFCLNSHLPLLGHDTHSLRVRTRFSLCLSSHFVAMIPIASESEHGSLCAYPVTLNCVLRCSISIALDIRLFFLILRPLSSNLLFPRLPHGNLDEPNTEHTLR